VTRRTYHGLIPYAFKRFCLLRAFKTALPTLGYYLMRKPLSPAGKPALCTMNILPPLATVWWHFARRALGDRVNTVIFDCSGALDPKEFEGVRVVPFLNFYAATKCQEFLDHMAKHRRIGWICDDDMFLLSSKCVDIVEREFTEENIASVSFRPRGWWEFEIDGKRHPVSSSYCTAINRETFCDTEHLSLGPCGENAHPAVHDRPPTRYDTFDKANEILLKKGYQCIVVPEEERQSCVTGFSGVSMGVMLLSYFKTPEQTLEYFHTPPKKQWEGTILHDAFGAMLAIDIVQELYEKLKGERYPLRSLPSREELLKAREEYEPLLGRGRDWGWVDEVGERLREEW
jgi:hypothetical protein